MLTLRSIRIALAILCSLCLFGIVKSSHGFEVTSMSVSNGASGCYASVTTDEEIICINWYVNNEYKKSTMPRAGTRYVCENLGYYPGDIKGVKLTITAEVWFWDGDNCVSDTDSSTIRAYKGIYLSQVGERTGAKGNVGISRFYYDGSHIIMDSYAYASNPSDNPEAGDRKKFPLTVLAWFWTHKYPAPDGNAEDEYRDTKDSETIDLGEYSQYYSPGPHRQAQIGGPDVGPFDRFVGTLKEGDAHYFKAHAHLQVAGTRTGTDSWEVDTQQQTGTAAVTFTSKDGP